ncbi:Tetratricopeptide repeat protein [Tenacibaculum sp. 190130A14a]|uniref:Tetratricopeptide repeat protein n=1 Tax=Tenacibaculum polynesiense TaxID=3137857 RepID=A0ABP1F2U6_9FLAO
MKKKLFYVVCIIIGLKVEAQVSTFKTIDSLTTIGRYQQALELLTSLPEDYIKNKKIAQVYETLDNYKTASKFYEKALSQQENYIIKLKLGKAYVKLGQTTKAISLFEDIIEKDPENLLARYQLGKLYLKRKQKLKAKDVFETLVKADKFNANYSYYLGVAYEKLKKNNKRIDSYLDAYKKDNEHIKAIEKLAIAYRMLRDKDSSSLFVEKGLQVAPYHINLNRLKINESFRSENYKEAIRLLKRIDSVKPNEHYTHKMLAKSYYELEQSDSAKIHFARAVKIDRSDFKSYIFLGSISFEAKDYQGAMINYLMATIVGKEPRDEAHLGMANVFFEQKKPKRVIEQYKKAIAENRNNYKALYLLANFSDNYYKDKKVAYKHYQRYVDRFESKDSVFTVNAERRIKEIKKEYFLKGEILE